MQTVLQYYHISLIRIALPIGPHPLFRIPVFCSGRIENFLKPYLKLIHLSRYLKNVEFSISIKCRHFHFHRSGIPFFPNSSHSTYILITVNKFLTFCIFSRLATMRMRGGMDSRADSSGNSSLLARLWAYLTEQSPRGVHGADPRAELRHNCFFTAVNCRWGPRGHVPRGAVRVRISDAERRAIMAALEKQNSDQWSGEEMELNYDFQNLFSIISETKKDRRYFESGAKLFFFILVFKISYNIRYRLSTLLVDWHNLWILKKSIEGAFWLVFW